MEIHWCAIHRESKWLNNTPGLVKGFDLNHKIDIQGRTRHRVDGHCQPAAQRVVDAGFLQLGDDSVQFGGYVHLNPGSVIIGILADYASCASPVTAVGTTLSSVASDPIPVSLYEMVIIACPLAEFSFERGQGTLTMTVLRVHRVAMTVRISRIRLCVNQLG